MIDEAFWRQGEVTGPQSIQQESNSNGAEYENYRNHDRAGGLPRLFGKYLDSQCPGIDQSQKTNKPPRPSGAN